MLVNKGVWRIVKRIKISHAEIPTMKSLDK